MTMRQESFPVDSLFRSIRLLAPHSTSRHMPYKLGVRRLIALPESHLSDCSPLQSTYELQVIRHGFMTLMQAKAVDGAISHHEVARITCTTETRVNICCECQGE